MQIKTHRFHEIAEEQLKNKQSSLFLDMFRQFFPKLREKAMTSFSDPQKAIEKSAAIRANVVAKLPELLEQFEKNALKHGAKVFWAKNANEANRFISNLAKKRKIKYVTKGKSMVTEEIALNQTLIENNIKTFESDLGEFITQLLDRPPFHIVGPAMNIPVEQINDIFLKKAGMKTPTHDPVKLGHAARMFLRNKFHHVEMGITGINMAVAQTGTIINVENEGNIRLTKSSPQTQVSIMTLEKVVPTMTDATHLLRVLCRSCTGQKLSAYVSMDTGPKKKDEIDGPEELFIVIVDNGRSGFYSDIQSRDALKCIRCGACLNVCPVYTKIGGYPYGWAYSGPMGQILSPLLVGLERTKDLYSACTQCSACKTICPAGINHPEMLTYFKRQQVEKELSSDFSQRFHLQPLTLKFFEIIITHPGMWKLFASIARFMMHQKKIAAFLKRFDNPIKKWSQSREFPSIAQSTFHERWNNHLSGEKDQGKWI